MRVVALVLLAGIACRNDPASTTIVTSSGAASFASTPAAPAAALPLQASRPDLVAIRATAHRVLSARCGECHESHRTTAKPAALAIFDLDHADWPSRFDAARFEAGLRRFGETPADDRAAFLAFRDAELAQRPAD